MSSSTNNIQDDEIDLLRLFAILWANKFKIFLVSIIGFFLAVLYVQTSPLIYRTDALLEITPKQNSVLSGLNELSGFGNRSEIENELDILKSRMILGQTVEQLQLDNWIAPNLSRFDQLIMMWNNQKLSKVELPQIGLTYFYLSHQDWVNKSFKINVLSAKSYQLITPDEQSFLGEVNKPLVIKDKAELLIFDLPEEQIEFSLAKLSFLNTIESLKRALQVQAKGKSSSLIELTYTGTDKRRAEFILNSIMDNYIEQNRNKDIKFAENGLTFIDNELPKLRYKLEEAENSLNAYRAKSGSLDIPTEARSALESLMRIEMQITELRVQEAGLAEMYTAEHPEYKALLDKINVLNQHRNRLNKQIASIPKTQQEVIRLNRDVEINQAIYVQLLNKQQELNIVKASSQGNVRIIDSASTGERYIKPQKLKTVAIAGIFSFILACGYFLLKASLFKGISTEKEIQELGLEVSASIPISESQKKSDRLFTRFKFRKGNARANTILALTNPTDVTVEALRALRTNIYFNTMNFRNPVIMISGASPEVGKSFISVNLAIIMAQSDKKVLLIDGDMRKGYLHYLINTAYPEQGLSSILLGDKNYADKIQKSQVSNLDFLCSGTPPENPAELLLTDNMEKFMQWAKRNYDYIFLDTPPVLAVTDPSIAGRFADYILLVSRFGFTTTKELQASMGRFSSNHLKINGVILNAIEKLAHVGAYEDHYYHYTSKYANKGSSKGSGSSRTASGRA